MGEAKKREAQLRRQEAADQAAMAGPYMDLRGAPALRLKTESSVVSEWLERLGFEKAASRWSYHSRYGRDDKKDEFCLWRHPAGLLLSTDTYRGMTMPNPAGPGHEGVYDPDFLRFNSFHLYWQAHVGADRGRSEAALSEINGSFVTEGDGTFNGVFHESFTQDGEGLVPLLKAINKMGGLRPLEQWKDAFFYLNPGLYLEEKRQGESAQGKGPEDPKIKAERMAFIKALPKDVRGVVLSQEPEMRERARALPRKNKTSDFNDQLSQCAQVKGVSFQTPSERKRLRAWDRGEFEGSFEALRAAGPCEVNGLHAMALALDEPERSGAKAALAALSDDELALLANAPDARGVSPFARCFELCRSSSELVSESAFELMEALAARLGPRLELSSSRYSALNALLKDAWPGREGGFFSTGKIKRALDFCADNGLGLDACFFKLQDTQKSCDGHAKRAPLRVKLADRGQALQAFIEEADRAGLASAELRASAERLALAGLAKPARPGFKKGCL